MFKTGSEPISGYRLESYLGSGNFGDVWSAQGPGGTGVALKFISLRGRGGYKELRSIQQIKRIVHPHLMPILGIWLLDQNGEVLKDDVLRRQQNRSSTKLDEASPPTQDGSRPMFLVQAMLLADANLHDLLTKYRDQGRAGIPPAKLLGFMEESAKGIDFLNGHHNVLGDGDVLGDSDLGDGPVAIQHCDIKPRNILLVGGSVQICDFGVATVLEDAHLTQVAGSPAYMAPECINRQLPSSTTDQYALAISYVELRTGKIPFRDEDCRNPSALMQAHVEGRLALDALPAPEQHVIRRATAIDPEKRFPTSLAMVRELQAAFQSSEPGIGDEADTRPAAISELPTEVEADRVEARTQRPAQNEASGVSQEVELATLQPGRSVGTPVCQETAPWGSSDTPQSTATRPSAPTDQTPAMPPNRKRMTGKVIAAVVICALSIGGVFAWQMFFTTPNQDPIAARFIVSPVDAVITVNGEPQTAVDGKLSVSVKPGTTMSIAVEHSDGYDRWERTIRFDELKEDGPQIIVSLVRSAQFIAERSLEKLDAGDFNAAVADYAEAMRKDGGRFGAPPDPIILTGHDGTVPIAVRRDGQLMATVSDKTVQLWDLRKTIPDESVSTTVQHESSIEAIALCDDGPWLAVGGFDGHAALWDLEKWLSGKGRPLQRMLPEHDGDVSCTTFSPDGKILVTATRGADRQGGTAYVWPLDRPDPTTAFDALEGHSDAISYVAISSDSRWLATSDQSHAILLWDLKAPDRAASRNLLVDPNAAGARKIAAVCSSPSEPLLGVGWDGGTTTIIGLADQSKKSDETNRDDISLLKFSPDGQTIFSGDVRGWGVLRPLHGGGNVRFTGILHHSTVSAAAFSEDGHWLITGGWDKRVRLIYLLSDARPTGKPIELAEHPASITAVALTDRWAIIACEDGSVFLWDYRRIALIDRARQQVEPAERVAQWHGTNRRQKSQITSSKQISNEQISNRLAK